jgi:hypothetical protein
MTVEWLERQAENRDLAELRVLGTMLARPDLSDITVARVGPELFRRDAHQILAEVIWSLRLEGKQAGPEEVLDRLIGREQVDQIGGAGALWELLRYEEDDTGAVEDLLRIERRRKVYQTCMDGARLVTNPDLEPDEVAATVFGRLRDHQAVDEKTPITTDELLEMGRPEWLIEGVLPEGLSVIFGSPKAGKSYVALTMAWSLATGRPWFSRNHHAMPKQVLYLAGEGVGDLRLRAESMLEHTNLHPGGRLAWWPVSLQLAKESDAARLRLEVEKIDAEVVIVDTWARYAGIRDENDAAQTQAALSALEGLTLDGRSVIVVHHTAKSGVMRGSSALAGAVEAAVRVQVNDLDGRVRLSSELSRRGVGFDDIILRWTKIGPDSVLMEDRP